MKRTPTIIDVMEDSRLFGDQFKGESWAAWKVFLRALFGLPMTPEDVAVYQKHTGRTAPPAQPAREGWLVVGRRGGKSFIVALIAVYLACFRTYRLAPGERGVCMILAADRKQARVIFRYIKALIASVPMLTRLVVAERAESLELANGVDIEVVTASYKTSRGYTCIAILADEIAFWETDIAGANADVEVINALLPSMASIPGALLIGISSPYARRGQLWEAFRDYYGKDDGDCLIWQADSRSMNSTLPQREVHRAYANDPISAAAEYGAQFRSDVSGFLPPEWIDRAIDEGISERAPIAGAQFVAFTDPSGGASDSFSLAIAHDDKGCAVLDVCRGRTPPFDPGSVVKEFCAILKTFGCTRVTGDRYAAQWVVEAFQKEGVIYRPAEKTKSEIYLESEPMFAQGIIRLLDNLRLLTELRQLERRTGAGRDRVDKAPRSHDDLANAAAGALVLAKPHGVMTDAAMADAEAANAAAGLNTSLQERMAEMEHNAVSGIGAPWDR